MKTNFQRSSRCWIGLLEGLAVAAMITSPAFAQTGDISTQTASSSDILAQYVEGQWTLTEGLQTLSLEGATDAQIEAWLQRNATQFQAQQQLSQILAMASALQPMMVGDSVTIPSGASGALVNFLTTSASLGNAFAEIHNQLLASMPAGATQADIDWMEQQAQQTFQQQNVGNLQLQVQQAQALGAASASIPLPVPGPAVIPSNATPELQAYLTARNALAAARAQIWNQYVTADPGVRDAAMRQWDRQNIAAIQQVSALAQALANSTANQ